MKIFNQKQLQDWDRYTIEVEGITALQLIAVAGEMLADEIEFFILQDYIETIHIYSGMGNNGADGLALARHLSEFNEDIRVFIVMDKEQGSPEFQFYLGVLEDIGIPISYIHDIDDLLPIMESDSIIVDALLGTGITRPVSGLMAEVIHHINSLQCDAKIAIDLPSGMHPDLIMDGPIVEADFTLSIASRKMTSFFNEYSRHLGKVSMVPLPLSHDYHTDTATSIHLIELFDMLLDNVPSDPHAYKMDFGHVLFIGGSRGKMGAALLASEAALRAGCGLLTAHVPSSGVDIMQIGLREAMVSVDHHQDMVSQLPDLDSYDAICIGCGLGQEVSPEILRKILSLPDVPKVLDADALNILAQNPDLLTLLDDTCVLTPHIGEFHRLFGTCENSQIRFEKLIEQSKSLACYIVLKGRYTMIATPEGKCYINMTGNAALGTAGSGDVLAGYLTGLLSQGLEVLTASRKAVCLHGFAGDLLLDENGPRGSLARDILRKLTGIDVHLKEMMEAILPPETHDDDDRLGLELLDNPN